MINLFKNYKWYLKNIDEGRRFGNPDNIEIIKTDNPVVEFYKNKGKIMVNVQQDCSIDFKLKCSKFKFFSKIPKGFKSDGASIPDLLRSFLSPWEIVFSALFHDSWYSNYSGNKIYLVVDGKMSPIFYDRTDADNLFLAIMKHNKVSKIKRRGAYGAVRLAGNSHWRVKEKKNV